MFFVFVQKSKPSSLIQLYSAGMPVAPVVQSGNEDYCKATYDWLLRNWHQNPVLIPYFVSLVADHREKGQLHLPVASVSELRRGNALLKVLNEDYEKIEQLSIMYKDFLGNKPPEISKMFDKMSYAERQEILRKSNQRLEEIPKEELQALKKPNPGYSLD